MQHYFEATDYCHSTEKHRWIDSFATFNYSPTLTFNSYIHVRFLHICFWLSENTYRFFALSTEAFPALRTGDLELIAVVDEAIWALWKREESETYLHEMQTWRQLTSCTSFQITVKCAWMRLQLFEHEHYLWEEVNREEVQGGSVTHMAAPQELWVLDESLLSQLLVEKIVHVRFKTIPELVSHTHTQDCFIHHSE